MEKVKQIFNLHRIKTTDMDYILGGDGNQMQFFALEEMVAEDSWARVIDVFVDILPLEGLGFKHATLQKEGRPPYDPSQLLKLYLYGYKYSIRSSRKLQHACKVNMELWWLLKGLKPSFRSIAYFRKDNAAALKAAFRYFVIMLQDMELIEGQTIAIDSFKVRAQNNFRKKYNQAKIDRHRTPACGACSIREDCTKNKKCRIIERTEYQDVIDENRERVLANKDYYKLRQQIIEHQFGILKRQWGFTYTLLKGKRNVLSEVHLMMTIYNLTRMIKILGIEVLKRKLTRLFGQFIYLYNHFNSTIKNHMEKQKIINCYFKPCFASC